jgi:hypothetical protein
LAVGFPAFAPRDARLGFQLEINDTPEPIVILDKITMTVEIACRFAAISKVTSPE